MKKKLPRWVIYLIGLGVSMAVSMLCAFLMDTSLSGIATYLIALSSLGCFVFPLALLIHGLRSIVHRTTRDHESLESELMRKKQPATRPTAETKSDTFRVTPTAPDVSWPGLIVLLITLFPMGIYLLILKTSYEKAHYFSNGVRLIFLGAVLMVPSLGFILLLLWTGADSANVLVMLCGSAGIPCMVGFFCFVFGWVLRHRGLENDAYRQLILIEHVTDIQVIAQRMSTSYAHATRVIERLIDCELLPNAYLYHRDHELIVPGISKKIALRCRNCSGTTVLYSNEERICAYCGGAL